MSLVRGRYLAPSAIRSSAESTTIPIMLSDTDKSEFPRVVEPPKFTLDDLKTAIGPELFKRNALLSLYYFFQYDTISHHFNDLAR
jgi:hypothetical protein